MKFLIWKYLGLPKYYRYLFLYQQRGFYFPHISPFSFGCFPLFEFNITIRKSLVDFSSQILFIIHPVRCIKYVMVYNENTLLRNRMYGLYGIKTYAVNPFHNILASTNHVYTGQRSLKLNRSNPFGRQVLYYNHFYLTFRILDLLAQIVTRQGSLLCCERSRLPGDVLSGRKFLRVSAEASKRTVGTTF